MFEVVKLCCVGISAYLVLRGLQRHYSSVLAFATIAIWLRFTLAAFHQFTHDPVVAGLSINALGSVAIVMVGLLVVPARAFLLRKLLPLYLFLLVVIVSGVLNGASIDLINVVLKWLYLLVLALAIALSIRIHSINVTIKTLLNAFSLPIGLLVLSIILGEVKATESDGSRSYIGGYGHESAFSMIVISFGLLVAFCDKQYLRWRSVAFYFSVVMLYLVNYRTAIIALFPIVLFFMLASVHKNVARKFYLPAYFSVGVAVFIIMYVASFSMSARFADIATLASNWDTLLKAPEYFSNTERRILSSRVYIWSQYVSEFGRAGVIQQLFGYGPESWAQQFKLYAHNTFVSYLYEYGVLGLSAFVGFILSLLHQAARLRDSQLKLKLLGGLLGFVIMNMATMPLWNLEGVIAFAIIFACIISGNFHAERQAKAALA